jgi:hypothetical protein
LKKIRFGELSVPLVDKMIKKIKKNVGVPTAKTSRSVISGVCGLTVLRGAMETNPVREIERIEGGKSKRSSGRGSGARRADRVFGRLSASR